MSQSSSSSILHSPPGRETPASLRASSQRRRQGRRPPPAHRWHTGTETKKKKKKSARRKKTGGGWMNYFRRVRKLFIRDAKHGSRGKLCKVYVKMRERKYYLYGLESARPRNPKGKGNSTRGQQESMPRGEATGPGRGEYRNTPVKTPVTFTRRKTQVKPAFPSFPEARTVLGGRYHWQDRQKTRSSASGNAHQTNLGEVGELGHVDLPHGESVRLAAGVLNHSSERSHHAAVPLDPERADDDPDNPGFSRALDKVVPVRARQVGTRSKQHARGERKRGDKPCFGQQSLVCRVLPASGSVRSMPWNKSSQIHVQRTTNARGETTCRVSVFVAPFHHRDNNNIKS